MNDFFIFEDELENVKSKRTQSYLKEVLSTYSNQEYRSCIVILYAITFTDFLEKIKVLADLYQDNDSTVFLADYEAKRKSNTSYSNLEKWLKNL